MLATRMRRMRTLDLMAIENESIPKAAVSLICRENLFYAWFLFYFFCSVSTRGGPHTLHLAVSIRFATLEGGGNVGV